MSTPPRTIPGTLSPATGVIGILQADYDSVVMPDLTGYIQTASNIIDRCVIAAANKIFPVTLDDITTELMERWLSAHFYVTMDQTYNMRSTLRASGRFQGQTGMMLMASKYGQMAVASDPSGCLNNVDRQSRVRVMWGGKGRCSMIPWWQRDGSCSPYSSPW